MGIARRMAARGLGAGLPPVVEGAGMAAIRAAPPYPLRLDGMVADGHPGALALADEIGMALAALVATLVVGPADARVARPEWPAAHWARWASVRRLALGGGLVSGALGQRLATSAATWLSRFGARDVMVELAADPRALVLRGIGTGLPDGRAVLLDAGHTSVKAAWSEVVDGRPRELRLAAPVAASSLLELRGPHLADRLVEIGVAAARDVAPGQTFASLGLAMALYTDASGQPRAGQTSAYGSLAEIPLLAHLRERLTTATGRPIAARASGDGAAAAAAVRGIADAAIVLGTAIGSGLNT